MQQQNGLYTSDDHNRWKLLMGRKRQLLAGASPEFIAGFEAVGLPEDRIPSFEEVNKVLFPATGWRYEAGGDEGTAGFFEALSCGVFPSAIQVRPWDEMDFCKLPDIFHDLFGHAGLLYYPPFADFLRNLGLLGVMYRHSEEALRFLSSIYWYTAEVGLVGSGKDMTYYGGSIISSASEIETVRSDASVKKAYVPTDVGQTPYDSFQVNDVYYCVDSISRLPDSLTEIRRTLLQYAPSSLEALL